ncbi:hypothetical protein KCP70_11670 [Salmonella enterica subsp. enterica]|nr:hypothetical protein KCP70_11670 [Salmonella enterica subsp. enterica]
MTKVGAGSSSHYADELAITPAAPLASSSLRRRLVRREKPNSDSELESAQASELT